MPCTELASDVLLKELAKYLSPQNESVKRGDVLACIRDLAQARILAEETLLDVRRHLETVIEALC